MRSKFMLRNRFTFGHKMLPRPTAMKPLITLEGDEDDEDDEDCENEEADDSDPYSGHVELGEEAQVASL